MRFVVQMTDFGWKIIQFALEALLRRRILDSFVWILFPFTVVFLVFFVESGFPALVVLLFAAVLVLSKKNTRKGALVPGEKTPCKLIEKISISYDVRLFRFALPFEDQVLGLPVGNYIQLLATVDGQRLIRTYTPTSSVDEVGHFDLVVKIYFKGDPTFPNGGLMSQYLDSMSIGSTVDVEGPFGDFEYTGRGKFMLRGKSKFAKKFAMLAGGTAITPIYQVCQAILKDPEDETEMFIVYANRTEDDILLREELDEWAKKHERVHVWYVVQDPIKEGRQYSTGIVTKEIMKAHIPEGSDDTMALLCYAPPMIPYAVKDNLEKMNYDINNSFLQI